MSTKKLTSSNFSFFASIRTGLLNLLPMFLLSACATPPPYITFSEPKVYSDNQVATVLGEQYRKLQAASKLEGKDLQEAFVIKQGTQLNTNIAASPAGTAPVAAPDKIASGDIDVIKLKIEEPSDVGLSYSASVRKKMNDEWEVAGRSLFLSGDQTFKDAGNVFLIRFDVSINNYIPADKFGDTQRFAYIRFTIFGCGTVPNYCKPTLPNDLKIYALEPEFNSTVGKEELITAALEDYQGEVGGTTEGVNLQGALRYQRALYEGFQKIVEQPLQFAVYGYNKNEFGCALGPVRQIVKRSWINPARIFGNKYRIDHIIEPGARQCYALIVLPNNFVNNGQLLIKAEYYRRDFLNDGDLFPNGGPSREQELCGTNSNCGLRNFIGYVADNSYRLWLLGDSWSAERTYPITVPKADKKENAGPKGDIEITQINPPVSIYPQTTNTVMVSTTYPLSPDTKVLIGPAAVTQENIELLGTKLLKVTIPANEALQALLKTGPTEQKMRIMTPGCDSQEGCVQSIDVKLMNSEEVKAQEEKDNTLKEKTITQKYVY